MAILEQKKETIAGGLETLKKSVFQLNHNYW
jgi:hypothetical protein